MVARRSILSTLAPRSGRRALVLSFDARPFRPGTQRYEELTEPVRAIVGVDLYGLCFPFGVLPEAAFVGCPEVFELNRATPERLGAKEMTVRTRAWFDGPASRYDRVVLLSYGPHMSIWSDAIAGSSDTDRVVIIPVHCRIGPLGTSVKKRLYKALT